MRWNNECSLGCQGSYIQIGTSSNESKGVHQNLPRKGRKARHSQAIRLNEQRKIQQHDCSSVVPEEKQGREGPRCAGEKRIE